MIPTVYSNGGEVEHDLFMIGGILFVVIEMKQGLWSKDNVAQLFLELLSAAEMNKKAEFEGLRVHGLLTDLQSFHFYSCDPVGRTFAFDETLVVNSTRDAFIADMIRVTNKIFSVVLFAYIEGLSAILKASRERPTAAPPVSSPAQQMLRNRTGDDTSGSRTRSGPRKSNEKWEIALNFATQCLTKFQEQADSVEGIEQRSCEAVELLTKSVRSIPRVSHYSGGEDPSTEHELRALARRIVLTEYTKLV